MTAVVMYDYAFTGRLVLLLARQLHHLVLDVIDAKGRLPAPRRDVAHFLLKPLCRRHGTYAAPSFVAEKVGERLRHRCSALRLGDHEQQPVYCRSV
jgi:hypothetical protein